MFYRPQDGHPLPHNPFKAIVAPRPIGWISTVDTKGRANLAPYSFFNAINESPPMVMFASGSHKPGNKERKDSVTNILETKEFCVNIVSRELSEAMNITSGHFPHGADEFERAKLAKGTGEAVKVPFVKDAPAVLECTLYQLIELPGAQQMVIGEVVGIHINDNYLVDGLLDVTRYQPLARLGYRDYFAVNEVFELNRPK